MDRFDLDALLARADLPEVAQRLGLELHRSGAGYVTLCPFHPDTKPSLRMFPSNGTSHQHFHCFACNAHGDAIALVKQVRGDKFQDAVRWLAAAFGVVLTRRQEAADAAVELKPAGFEFAAGVFTRSHDATAFAEWSSGRGYSAESLYALGFRLVRGHSLVAALRALPLNQALPLADELESLGLLRRLRRALPTEGKSYYLPLDEQLADTFSDGRVVFPIRDKLGNVVAYSGRRLDDAVAASGSSPKYLNSKGFRKGEILFNLDRVTSSLRSTSKANAPLDVYLVEGFMDAIRLDSLGIAAVALMGTSISAEQLKLLGEINSERSAVSEDVSLKLFLDQDDAGYRASHRAIRQLLRLPSTPVSWIAFDSASGREVGLSEGKDPDACLRNLQPQQARDALTKLVQPAVAAIVLDELGGAGVSELSEDHWATLSPYRRDRALFATARSLRSWKEAVSSWEIRLTTGVLLPENPSWLRDLVKYMSRRDRAKSDTAPSSLFLQSEIALRNHARALAYHGSRRGELPCDEPTWQCIDVAWNVFDILLVERMASDRFRPSAMAEAVNLPRKLSADPAVLRDPRLKMMPHPADLILQQYLLNELLTERHDLFGADARTFSECIPAVRYYRSTGRTLVTGLERTSTDSEQVLSFAYQVDMEVLEGASAPTDQGMFRPFGECWREFMGSINRQIRSIGRVHVLRLDAKRYYDNIRRYVVRDRLMTALSAALAPAWPPSLLPLKDNDHDVSRLVDVLCDSMFHLPYRDPKTGKEAFANQTQGIPQGPVISAWVGTITLFPVDEAARALMKRYESEGDDGKRAPRLGYARYVDDIVLVADSAELLRELRSTVQSAASQIELVLMQKGGPIEPGEAEAVIDRLNEGRIFIGSTPAWEPPLAGDGEWGWSLSDDGLELNRQSALRILRHPELLEQREDVLSAVRSAIGALDLRAGDLGKCARWVWWQIATDPFWAPGAEEAVSKTWHRYWVDWKTVTDGRNWGRAFEDVGYAELAALEGLDRLLDADPWMELGLTAAQLGQNRSGLDRLATLVANDNFFPRVRSGENTDHLERRQRLIGWKAKRRLNPAEPPTEDNAEVARNRSLAVWFRQATAQLMSYAPRVDQGAEAVPPLASLRNEDLLRSDLELPVTEAVQRLLSGRSLADTALQEMESSATSQALRLIVAATKRDRLWDVIHSYRDLLKLTDQFSALPPLPGLSPKYLLGYIEKDRALSLAAYSQASESLAPSDFWGAKHTDGSATPRLEPAWGQPSSLGPLRYWQGEATLQIAMQLPGRPEIEAQGAARYAAQLFRALLGVWQQYADASQSDGYEMVPVSAHLAVGGEGAEQRWYIVAEPMLTAELGATAWLMDGGSSLRSVSVPLGDAHLWRIGVTVTDVIGLGQDALASGEEAGLEQEVVTNLDLAEDYVLRQQLRKLRGTFVDRATVRHESASGLPLTVERSLRILESFPLSDADDQARSFAVLETESETQAMILRLNQSGAERSARDSEGGLRRRFHELALNVLRRLPLSVIEAIQVEVHSAVPTRGDLASIYAVSRTISNYEPWQARRCDAAAALRISAAIAVATVGLRGLIASLLGTRQAVVPETLWIPEDWRQPDGETSDPQAAMMRARDAIQRDDWAELNRTSAWSWVLLATTVLKEHLSDTARFEAVRGHLQRVYDVLRAWEEGGREEGVPDRQWTWPFEDLPSEEASLAILSLTDQIPSLIAEFDRLLEFDVRRVCASRYGLNRHDQSFTDAGSRTWRMRKAQFTELPNPVRVIERDVVDGEVLLVWTEVRHRQNDDQLLSIHLVEDKLAKLVHAKSFGTVGPQAKAAGNIDASRSKVGKTELARESPNAGTDQPAIEKSTDEFRVEPSSRSSGAADEELVRLSSTEERQAEAPSDSVGASNRATNASVVDWRNARLASWRDRANPKSTEPGYTRIAIFQFRIDDSYSHPLVEAGIDGLHLPSYARDALLQEIELKAANSPMVKAARACAPGEEHLWDESATMFSWPEHRRRRLLSEAVQACKALNVDLLVLPEYSIRAETVEWLESFVLHDAPGLAVLAGTYRDPQSLTAPLSLLWTPPSEVQKKLVPESLFPWPKALRFSRGKKYRAVAVKEFFRPYDSELAPLFDPAEVIDRIVDLFPAAASHITPRIAAQVVSKDMPSLRYCMELICSELFMLSSPANLRPLVRELFSVRRHFQITDTDVTDEVTKDIQALARVLDIGHSHTYPRRSILIVPAATGRTSDYWLAGQASVLASATATVFCNGVLDKLFLGGSCFIGNECTTLERRAKGFIGTLTPYHGWSKGIHSGSPSDPLGASDQALLVADLNPVHVVEGKPRPQLLPAPMRLVAYLPVVETLNRKVNASSVKMHLEQILEANLSQDAEQLLEQIDSPRRRPASENFENSFAEVCSDVTEGGKLDASRLESFSAMFGDRNAIQQRLRAWERDRAQQPARGQALGALPPALVDVLPVDVTLQPKHTVRAIHVPAWSSHSSLSWPGDA